MDGRAGAWEEERGLARDGIAEPAGFFTTFRMTDNKKGPASAGPFL
jgi:hypothetical protein